MAQEEERKTNQRQRGNQDRRSEARLLHAAQAGGLEEELVFQAHVQLLVAQ